VPLSSLHGREKGMLQAIKKKEKNLTGYEEKLLVKRVFPYMNEMRRPRDPTNVV
jgi:hypothetical protein